MILFFRFLITSFGITLNISYYIINDDNNNNIDKEFLSLIQRIVCCDLFQRYVFTIFQIQIATTFTCNLLIMTLPTLSLQTRTSKFLLQNKWAYRL